MSDIKWTPGPWSLRPCHNGGALLYRPNGAQEFLQIMPVGDAHLIAAAPELYEALICIDFDDGAIAEALGENLQNKIIAALAKARGE